VTTIVTNEDIDQMYAEYQRTHEQRENDGMNFSQLINYLIENEYELDEEKMVFRKRQYGRL